MGTLHLHIIYSKLILPKIYVEKITEVRKFVIFFFFFFGVNGHILITVNVRLGIVNAVNDREEDRTWEHN